MDASAIEIDPAYRAQFEAMRVEAAKNTQVSPNIDFKALHATTVGSPAHQFVESGLDFGLVFALHTTIAIGQKTLGMNPHVRERATVRALNTIIDSHRSGQVLPAATGDLIALVNAVADHAVTTILAKEADETANTTSLE